MLIIYKNTHIIFYHKNIYFVEKIKKAESDFWDITFYPLLTHSFTYK